VTFSYSLVAEYEKVTPELIQKTAQEYLRPGNRTVLLIQPAPAATVKPAGDSEKKQ
jgi:predicted Zn-dependent peptidase